MPPRALLRVTPLMLVALSVAGLTVCAHVRPAPPDWRDRLTKSAQAVNFGPDTPPVRADGGGDYPSDVPRMQFAQSTAPRGKAGVATRVTSERDYPRLGIAKGVNYVWVVAGKTPRIAVIPADASKPAYWLKTALHARQPGDICQSNPLASQLSIETSAGGDDDDHDAAGGPHATTDAANALAAQAAMCICVGGGWYHGGSALNRVSDRDAGVFLP